MSAETITTRIHEKADAELKQKIAAAYDAFFKAMNAIGCQPYYIKSKVHRSYLRNVNREVLDKLPDLVEIDLDKVLENARDAAFDHGAEAYRTKAVDAFMSRVDEIVAQVEELKNEIESVRQD